jgi:hypothetical protein
MPGEDKLNRANDADFGLNVAEFNPPEGNFWQSACTLLYGHTCAEAALQTIRTS